MPMFLIPAAIVYMSSEQKKAQTKSKKSAEQAAALQEAKMKDLAGQQYQITQQQMQLQQGQRQIQVYLMRSRRQALRRGFLPCLQSRRNSLLSILLMRRLTHF